MDTRLILKGASLASEMLGINDYAFTLTAADVASGRHRELVGSLWHELGNLQFEFLQSQGLTPDMRLLDVGCGCLRGGLHFIRYLHPGHYTGVDINAALLNAGIHELEKAGLSSRGATLFQAADFDFRPLQEQFDVAIAVSVFTHLYFNHVARCLKGVQQVLAPSGVFYATFFEAPTCQHLEPIQQAPADITTYFDKDPFHCHPEELSTLARWAGLRAEYIGDWEHPRGQKMIAFRQASQTAPVAARHNISGGKPPALVRGV